MDTTTPTVHHGLPRGDPGRVPARRGPTPAPHPWLPRADLLHPLGPADTGALSMDGGLFGPWLVELNLR